MKKSITRKANIKSAPKNTKTTSKPKKVKIRKPKIEIIKAPTRQDGSILSFDGYKTYAEYASSPTYSPFHSAHALKMAGIKSVDVNIWDDYYCDESVASTTFANVEDMLFGPEFALDVLVFVKKELEKIFGDSIETFFTATTVSVLDGVNKSDKTTRYNLCINNLTEDKFEKLDAILRKKKFMMGSVHINMYSES